MGCAARSLPVFLCSAACLWLGPIPTQGLGPDNSTSPSFPAPSAAATRRVASLLDLLHRRASGGAEREQALDGLIEIGPEAIPLLVDELEKRYQSTWPETIYVLGAIGDPRVIPILRDQLMRQSGRPYMDTLYALTLAGDSDALLVTLRSTNATAAFEPGPGGTALDFIAGSIGPPAIEVLTREIPKRVKEVRGAAIGAIATIGSDAAIPFLEAWAKRSDPSDRQQAIWALGRIGDPRARQTVLDALGDEAPEVREAATWSVGWLRDPRAVPLLAPLLQKRGLSQQKTAAIWSLGLIGGAAATQALESGIKLSLDDERAQFIQALGNTNDPRALPTLVNEAVAPHPLWSPAATRAVISMRGVDGSETLLTICSQASDLDALFEAARALVKARDPRSIPCVMRSLQEELNQHQGVTDRVEELLRGLPLTGQIAAIPSLERLAEDSASAPVQHRLRSAAHALELVRGNGSDVAPWLQLLEKGSPLEVDVAIRRLADLGDARAIEPLRRLFGRIDPERATLIPEALGAIGSERATPFLKQILTDDVYRVPSLLPARREAAIALAAYSRTQDTAATLRQAYLAEPAEMDVALLALAKVRGSAAIPDLVDLNVYQLRRRHSAQVERHERVNWAIRMLRTGQEIPIELLRSTQR